MIIFPNIITCSAEKTKIVKIDKIGNYTRFN